MAEIVRSGSASITVEQDRVRRLLDRATEGAASGFIQAAQQALADVQREAVPRWPVATGKSAAAFVRRVTVRGDRLEVSLVNTATNKGYPYPRFLRFSVFTETTVKRNLSERDDFVNRGTTPEARQALGELWDNTRRLTSSEGAPDERSAGKRAWNRLIRTPGRRRARTLIEAQREQLARLARRA